MVTAIYTHADCRRHDMGPGHPESPLRLDAIRERLARDGADAAFDHREAPPVDRAALLRAHSADHVERMETLLAEAAAAGRPRAIDADTVAGPGTWQAALRAAGAAVAATDAVIDGTLDNAFCAVRPPGHHATRRQAMGFCFFNNVVVAARHALDARGLERVAIVDFDVHHGNGTEDIVAGDDRILMVGLFQHPLYPGSGVRPLGPNVLNVPLPSHTGGDDVRQVVDAVWVPRLDAFKPQMLFVSAGFDAHREDPLASLDLVEDDYAWITRRLREVAGRHAAGRIVSCLEGGYALGALGRSVEAHVKALAGV